MAAPAERAGAAAALSETSSEFGGAVGIAVLGSIGAAVYRGRMIDAVPASLAPDVADAARSTLAGVVAVAEHLPGSLSVELIAAARLAFAHAFDVTAVVTAAVVLVTAALVAIVLRDRSSEQVLAPATVSCQ